MSKDQRWTIGALLDWTAGYLAGDHVSMLVIRR